MPVSVMTQPYFKNILKGCKNAFNEMEHLSSKTKPASLCVSLWIHFLLFPPGYICFFVFLTTLIFNHQLPEAHPPYAPCALSPSLWQWARAAGRPWHCWAASLQSAAWGCWDWQSARTTGCTWRRASSWLWTKAWPSRPRCTRASGGSASWMVSNESDRDAVVHCALMRSDNMRKVTPGGAERCEVLRTAVWIYIHDVQREGLGCCHSHINMLSLCWTRVTYSSFFDLTF